VPATPPTDAELARRCLDGGADGYALLLERHKGRVYSFLLRLVGDAADAEDLAQTAFLKAFRSLDSYDPSRPFLSWLFGIAHHAGLDFLRARRPRELALDDADAPLDLPDESSGPEAEVESALQAELVERLLRSLPAPYREVLLLRHAEDMSVEQAAAVLSLPVGTVKVRLFRAREMMRARWESVSGEKKFETRKDRRP
jgi:RNA polymerase sigma-70 factor (ECF subfamily)